MTTLTDRAAAIRHHYDIGNEFYRLWLDRSLTYSCAMRERAGDTLDIAQERKLKYHLDAIRAEQAESVLDIGCGWGSILQRLSGTYQIRRSVGLTLSNAQAEYVSAQAYPGVQVRTEDWLHYEPEAGFDGIISIGAFEHFARPDDSSAQKIERYRQFFGRCHDWLNHDGVLSLQTIAYANMSRFDACRFIQQGIFPGADLPTLAEITAAADGIFEVSSLRNDRLDYAWTCEQWVRRLRGRHDEAVALVGPEMVARYARYLKLSALGFRMGKIALLRIVLKPFRSSYFSTVAATVPV
jgi:cyclopropane-fatty-acyl-phospholipid synthase